MYLYCCCCCFCCNQKKIDAECRTVYIELIVKTRRKSKHSKLFTKHSIIYVMIYFLDFKESLETIQQAIDECDFMAIDGEFTGLNHAGFSHSATFDTPEERYYKVLKVNGCLVYCHGTAEP